MLLFQFFDQGYKRHFGSIRNLGKHAFPTENMPHIDPVQTADQCVILPYFHRFGDSQFVQFAISLNHLVGNPGSVLTIAFYLLAIRDDFPEILVESQPENIPVQDVPHTFGNHQFVQKQHHSGVWRPPNYGFIVFKPRKDAALVSQQQSLGGQITANGENSIQIGMGNGRKKQFLG